MHHFRSWKFSKGDGLSARPWLVRMVPLMKDSFSSTETYNSVAIQEMKGVTEFHSCPRSQIPFRIDVCGVRCSISMTPISRIKGKSASIPFDMFLTTAAVNETNKSAYLSTYVSNAITKGTTPSQLEICCHPSLPYTVYHLATLVVVAESRLQHWRR